MGSAGRAGLNPSFQISLKIKNALGEYAFGFAPVVAQGLRRWVAVGFSFLGIPVCLNAVLIPASGLCEASPVALPFAPSGRVRREYTTMA